MAVFYGLYYFVLHRFTFYTLNRLYLLFTIMVSFVIPAVSFETTRGVTILPALATYRPLSQVMPSGALTPALRTDYQTPVITSQQDQKTSWQFYMVCSYIFIAALLLIMLFTKLLKIIRLAHQAERVNDLWIIERSVTGSNASFFNLIFLNTQGLTEYEKAQVLAHERVHAQALHSLDVLITELCKIVLWFNPVIYFYKKSLVEVHEFEADLITTQLFDSKNYAHLLLKLGINHHTGLSNPFSKHPLSTRIQFLFKQRTSTFKKLLYILCLPLVAISVFAFAQRNEKIAYQKIPVNSIKKFTAPLSVKLVESSKDTITPKNKQVMPTIITKSGSGNTRPFSIEYPALNTAINLPALSIKHVNNRVVTVVINIEKTPERYAFDLLRDDKFISPDIPEVDFKVFREGKELFNVKDFDYVVENNTIKEVIFKPYIQSETEGVTFQFKKQMSLIPEENKNNNAWRYKNRLGEPMPYAPGIRATQTAVLFQAVDSLKKGHIILRKK